jgi:hypothetical protein
MMEMLQTSQCRVIFTKLNGEERDMLCTLKDDVIPKATKDPITQKKVRDLNEEVLAVWDVNKEGWRSFRISNVVSFVCE